MKRQTYIAPLAFLLLFTDPPAANRDTIHPNVLLIMTDDQGYGDFSLHGNPYVRTPVADRLATGNIQFERFFVSPLCAPTRASLLTGRYWLRSGVWGVTQSKETMRSEEVTLAEALKSAGYRTGMFGKWHNGEQYPYTPPGQGFDEFLGFHNGHWNNYFDAELLHGAEFVKTKGYITDVLTDEALKFIETNRRGPFFCYVAYNAPHAPFQVPDKYFDRFKARGLDDALAAVYGMCESIDDNLGRLLSKLDELKLSENTVVLFLTDNGANTNRYNAGMRGRKGSVHEGGSRVPLFLRWPARFKQPRVISQIASHTDLYPTLLDLCGVKIAKGLPLDGRSLRPLLEGGDRLWTDRILFTHNVRGGQQPAMYPGAARTQQYRLVNEGKGYELYEMLSDPGETRNLAVERPGMVKKLSQAYEAWYRDASRAGFSRFPIRAGYAEENPVILQAPQAYFTGTIHFFGNNGFANDWLTGWTDVSSEIYWDIEVVNAGTYEVSIAYLCPASNAGSRIRVAAGKDSLEAEVGATPVREIPPPNRVTAGTEGNTYASMLWATLKVGRLDLQKGRTRLTIRALEKAGTQVMDLKSASLKRLP
ncbi:MAG TPA: arylsulfatase [Acidobacteriota bacterium]|jgi:arylsulfatase A